MFKNMGGKIKMLAKVMCWINIALGIIAVFAGIFSVVAFGNISGHSIEAAGVICLIILAGIIWALFAWIGSFFLCGYGELIENSAITAKNTQTLIEMKSYELNARAKSQAGTVPEQSATPAAEASNSTEQSQTAEN